MQDLAGFMALACCRMSPEARKEYSDQVVLEFANLPFSLLTDAVATARQSISFPEKLVPFVIEIIEKRQAKLAEEGRVLKELTRIADGRQD